MKIVAIDHWLVSIPYKEQIAFSSTPRNNATRLIVRLQTDTGVVGWGETLCLLDFIEPVLKSVVVPTALGLSVHDIERLGRLVEASGYYHHQRAAVMATSAVELAMWDAYGKALGVPCHLLWGGRFRDQIEIAAYTMTGDIATFDAHVRAMCGRGYLTYKIKIGFGEDLDVEMIRTARKLIGSHKLRADVNSVWTQGTARRILRKVEDTDLQYIEQPLPVYDLAGHAELRGVQSTPVALDESAYSTGDVGAIIGARAADALLLDPSEAGGVWEVRKQAAAAEAACIPVGLHSGGEFGPSLGAYLNIAACTPNMWLALDWSAEHLSDVIVKNFQYLPEAGFIPVPTAPGLSVEVDIAKIERYAVDRIPSSYRPPQQTGGRIPMKSHFDNIPDELLEAGRVDGATNFQIMTRIFLPLARPGLVAVGLFAFIRAWNDFIYALALGGEARMTLPPGLLLQFGGEFRSLWPDLMAASFVTALPVMVCFMFLQKHFIEGLTAGAVKG